MILIALIFLLISVQITHIIELNHVQVLKKKKKQMKTDITGIKLSNTNYTARLHSQPDKIFRFKWKTVILASACSYYALNESSLTKGTKKVIAIMQLTPVS